MLGAFDTVESRVVTSGDVAPAAGCSRDSARRKLDRLYDRGRVGRHKTAGRVVYWRLAGADLNPVDPDDPIFTDRASSSSGNENLSAQVDELLYGDRS